MTAALRPSVPTLRLVDAKSVQPLPYTRILLAVLLLANLSAKLYLAADPHLHPADECYHALVAKNLLHHPLTPTLYDHPALGPEVHAFYNSPDPTRDWSFSHFWLHKPPLATWLMAASMAVFGVSEWACRLPAVVLSTLAILLTFAIGKRLVNPRVGLLAAYFHGVYGMLITLAAGFPATDHIDAIFVVLVELATYLALRAAATYPAAPRLHRLGRPALCGLALGLALLTKWLPALIVVPVFLAAGPWPPRRRALRPLAIIGLVAALVAGPWQLYVQLAFPGESNWERAYNARHLWEVLEYQHRPIYQYLRDLPVLFGYLAPLAVGYFLLQAFRYRHEPARRVLAVWFLVPYAFFTVAATKMPNYVAIAARAVFLMEAWAVWDLLALRPARWWLGLAKWAALAGLLVLPASQSATMVLPPLRTARWAWLDQDHARDLAIAATLRQLDRSAGLPDNTVVFGVRHRIEAMFYTRFTVYEHPPTPSDIVHLQAAGRPIVILDDGTMPPAFRTRPGILVIPVAIQGL